jgi:D-alanyl-lipoteichoic acid acyltransferase DltB (MBOAT superfamily)
MTFIFDNYYETINEKYTYIDYCVFASFFPTIIAGPIEKASRLLPQIKGGVTFSSHNISKGITLITLGMFRKVLIGDTCGSMVDQVFAEPGYYLSPEVLITLFLYSFQLYNDFAGYSSIARGIARLFGFEIISNFKQPYFSQSISEFWKRWHISLAIWLRDYLFKPLQFKYRSLGKYGNVLGIMITFIICGLWHGPSWGYIFWGFSQGFYISYSFLTIGYRENLIKIFRIPSIVVKSFRMLFTFSLITLTFLFFRADSFSTAFQMISIIFNWTSSNLTLQFSYALIAVSLFSFTFDLLELKYKSQAFLLKMKPALRYGISFGLWIVILLYLLTAHKLPFIYAQF